MQKALNRRFETLDRSCPFYATRQRAIASFKSQGLPTQKSETYRYTPISNLLEADVNWENPAAAVREISKTSTLTDCLDIEAYHVVMHDDQIDNDLTRLGRYASRIQVLGLKDADQQQQRTLREHFGKYASSETEAFTALNTALFEGGLFIYITGHTVVDKPLVVHHYTKPTTYRAMTHPRLLIVAESYSQADIVVSWNTTGFTNAVTEVVLQENARLNYYTLQTHLNDKNYQVNTTRCYQAGHSTLNTYTFTWSGDMVRNNLSSVLDAPHSSIHMHGLYCPRGRQHIDNYTTVDHRKPRTSSHELYKGVMMDASTGVFNGRICVRPEAQKTQAFQANNNLMFSDLATLHTKPQLEIGADDVKCSHGATIGHIDEEQLFYLQARGIQKCHARSLLWQAFANEVIENVPWPALRTQLHSSLRTQADQEDSICS